MAEDGHMIDMRVDITGSSLNAVRTQAAIRRLAVALERRLKEAAPINKNPTPSKGGQSLRSSISVTAQGSLSEGIDLQCVAKSTVRYVIQGTSAHTITAVNGKTLAFPWNRAARSHQSGIGFGARIRRSSRLPISGYYGAALGDLRRLIRTSDLSTNFDDAHYQSVHHPGASANDFISTAVAQLGPDIDYLQQAVGEDVADQVMSGLNSAFGSMSMR